MVVYTLDLMNKVLWYKRGQIGDAKCQGEKRHTYSYYQLFDSDIQTRLMRKCIK